jgi:hypothetical protein
VKEGARTTRQLRQRREVTLKVLPERGECLVPSCSPCGFAGRVLRPARKPINGPQGSGAKWDKCGRQDRRGPRAAVGVLRLPRRAPDPSQTTRPIQSTFASVKSRTRVTMSPWPQGGAHPPNVGHQAAKGRYGSWRDSSIVEGCDPPVPPGDLVVVMMDGSGQLCQSVGDAVQVAAHVVSALARCRRTPASQPRRGSPSRSLRR